MASQARDGPDVYFDEPPSEAHSLEGLLEREDVAAVIVCLPILAQPEVIYKALTAGKHVFSEKPIAKDVTTARQMIDHYHTPSVAPIWAVGENLRFLDTVVYGAQRLHHLSAELVTFSMKMFMLIADDDKFYNTEW